MLNMFGGDIYKKKAFQHILSIGFEFETNDLCKLSLEGNTLINSDMKTPMLENYILNGRANKSGENSYEIMEENEDGLFYTEYFDEKNEDDKNVILQVTNDIGTTDFGNMVSKLCSKMANKIHKKNMYFFKTTDNTTYPIKFTEGLLERHCSIFAGTEWIITYYKPKISDNIILETFLDASKRILSHLSNLKKQTGNLYITNNNNTTNNSKKVQKIGNIVDRLLYHKPDTNLYYLQTNDNILSNPNESFTVRSVVVLPQMTIRLKVQNIVEVMKGILEVDTNKENKINIRNRNSIYKEYELVEILEKCVKELFSYSSSILSKVSKSNISILKGYIFLILYKLCIYISVYSQTDITVEENYFKNYISFMSRHTNYEFYTEIKKILQNDLKVSPVQVIETFYSLMNQNIISKYLPIKKIALKQNITDINDKDYGDPNNSFMSYFYFFENPKENTYNEDRRDWLLYSNKDTFTSRYDIKDNTILIENRYFSTELSVFAKESCNVNIKNGVSLTKLKTIYNCLVNQNKVKKLYENNTKTLKKTREIKPRKPRQPRQPRETRKNKDKSLIEKVLNVVFE